MYYIFVLVYHIISKVIDQIRNFNHLSDPFQYSNTTFSALNAQENTFFDWAMENKHWVDLYTNLGARQSVMDAILVGCNGSILNYNTVMKRVFEESILAEEIEVFPVCPRRSALVGNQFVTNRRELPPCSVCLSKPSSAKYFSSIPSR